MNENMENRWEDFGDSQSSFIYSERGRRRMGEMVTHHKREGEEGGRGRGEGEGGGGEREGGRERVRAVYTA